MAVKRISALFFVLLLLAGLSGCGRTGKLYLPDDKPETTKTETGSEVGGNKPG